MGTCIVGIILACVVAVIIRVMIKNRKKGGCSGCSGDCSRCKDI